MRAAAVFLFALIAAPIRLELAFEVGNRRLLSGYIVIRLYGAAFRLPLRMTRPKAGGSFYLQIARFQPIRIRISLKGYKKPGVRLKNHINSWRSNFTLSIKMRLSLGDACHTALTCGTLQALLSAFPQVDAAIRPVYGEAGFDLQVRCIAVFRLGKLFLTAILVGLERLSSKTAGGAANGNHSESANQFSHADSP